MNKINKANSDLKTGLETVAKYGLKKHLSYSNYIKKSKEINRKLVSTLKEKIKIPNKLLTSKLSSGADKPPILLEDYYRRLISILYALIQRPTGVKKLSKMYMYKKMSKTKPPVMKNMSRNASRIFLKLLASQNYLNSNAKGYYTSLEGKKFLTQYHET